MFFFSFFFATQWHWRKCLQSLKILRLSEIFGLKYCPIFESKTKKKKKNKKIIIILIILLRQHTKSYATNCVFLNGFLFDFYQWNKEKNIARQNGKLFPCLVSLDFYLFIFFTIFAQTRENKNKIGQDIFFSLHNKNVSNAKEKNRHFLPTFKA